MKYRSEIDELKAELQTLRGEQTVQIPNPQVEVRLTSYPKGRVELYKNGTWGTLCGHYWWDNQKGAENICRQLGYTGGTKYTAPGGTGPIQTGNRLFEGGEATIWDCPLKRGELDGCTHDIDQGVNCCTTKDNA